MKSVLLILFSALIFVSCSNNNDTSFDINGQFTDNIVKCSSFEVEPNCFKAISFIDELKAYIFVYGDNAIKVNYKIEGNKIKLEKNIGYNQDISFIIINEKTLKRIQDDAIFLKED